MKSNNSRIDGLKAMLALEERRSSLQQEIDRLVEKLSALKEQLFSGDEEATTKTKAAKSSFRVAATKSAGGSLRSKVFAALEAAGRDGIYVKELAGALGVKPVNIHSWFHSNIKRNPAIKKITGGHYRLEGKASNAAVKGKPGPKAKASKAPESSKETTPGVSGRKRGALSARVMEVLQAAGTNGISVKEMSDKLDAKYKNIYVWFATTGKKNARIKKVGPATYKLS